MGKTAPRHSREQENIPPRHMHRLIGSAVLLNQQRLSRLHGRHGSRRYVYDVLRIHSAAYGVRPSPDIPFYVRNNALDKDSLRRKRHNRWAYKEESSAMTKAILSFTAAKKGLAARKAQELYTFAFRKRSLFG